MKSIDLRKFPFRAFLYSVFFVCCFHTPTDAMGTNSGFWSFCGCGGETENDRHTSPSKLSPNTIEREAPPHSFQKNKELAAAKDEEAVPLLQAGNGETSADEERPVSLAEDTDSISISLSIKESDGSSVLEDHGLKNYITSLLNRKRPSRLDVSLINKEGNCLGNAQFCTYTAGTEPKFPSPKPSKSSKTPAKDTEEMKPLLHNKPFSEPYIGKTSRSIWGMQIEDIAWTYTEHFFNELEKKKDDNLLFSYYGYKLPEAHAFARIETSTIVYDLTLPRKEGVGSVASSSTVRTAKKYK